MKRPRRRFAKYVKGRHNQAKVGLRGPDVAKSITTRKPFVYFAHPKRAIIHGLGIKFPKGLGWMNNPKKYFYNKRYKYVTLDPAKPIRKRFRNR